MPLSTVASSLRESSFSSRKKTGGTAVGFFYRTTTLMTNTTVMADNYWPARADTYVQGRSATICRERAFAIALIFAALYARTSWRPTRNISGSR